MKCEYCARENDVERKHCAGCGAELKAPQVFNVWKSDPIFYNGHIIWIMREPGMGKVEVQFWRGQELIERMEFYEDFLKERIPPYQSWLPFFWDLFLVAQGEKECIEWKERNSKLPATFIISRVENAERLRMRALDMNQIAEEARR